MSLAETPQQSWMGSLSPKAREKLKALSDEEAAVLIYEWERWARPNQLPPTGDWDGWLVLGGRGGGKTRTATEWVRANVESGTAKRIALISETAADGRDVLVEGESGILKISPPWFKPLYESSKRRVTWPNGAVATLYDAREPDQLRGPQHDLAVLDEGAKYRYAQDVFDQMLLGLRLGSHPRWLMTTTPRPIKLIKDLLKDSRVAVTRYSSRENLMHLARTFRANIIDRYAGTRIGRQEIDAEVLEDVPGALWTRRNLDENRVKVTDVPALMRLVVAIDPAITSGDSANETGIIVAGIDEKQHGYTIEDATLRGSPDQWARRAISMYRKYEADKIVAEANQGGEMVERVLRSIDPSIPITLVRATRGKYVRAEPVSALYEQGRVSHVGTLPELEDQMIAFTPEVAAVRDPGESPDRVDALVWAFTDLFTDMTIPERVEHDDYADHERMSYAASRDPDTGY